MPTGPEKVIVTAWPFQSNFSSYASHTVLVVFLIFSDSFLNQLAYTFSFLLRTSLVADI
jgi:hypothetical protein